MGDSLLIRLLERLEMFLYRRAAAIVAVTGSFRRELVARGIPEDRIQVVVNGVDGERFAPRERDPGLVERLGLGSDFVVGYIGTLGLAHGLDLVLDCAVLLRDSPIRFLIVGGGAARDALVARARDLGLAKVVFVDRQPRDAVPAYWSLCDLALIHLKPDPLFESVIPSKMFEAMGMGLPILLAMPRGEAAAIVEQADAGVWVEPGRPAELAEAVRALAADPARLARLARNSHLAGTRFTRAAAAQRMLDVLLCVAGAPDSPPRREAA
jgi:glycosyltransferase involved in cell wall biosynthesis